MRWPCHYCRQALEEGLRERLRAGEKPSEVVEAVKAEVDRLAREALAEEALSQGHGWGDESSLPEA